MILKDINWRVKRGENWVILGLNGSGKTTLLNMVTGYLWPSQGEIWVLGKKYGTVDLREHRKKIGWVSSSFQEKMHTQDRAENIVVSGKFASIGLYEEPSKEDIEYAAYLMEILGCIHVRDRTYLTCSQGEKQKLLIARALMSRPELLILDEPCNGLDFISREQLLENINDLADEEHAPTMIYVTHHIEEITAAFPKTLLIRDGEIFSAGDTSAVLSEETMSEFFNMPLELTWNRQRAWLLPAER